MAAGAPAEGYTIVPLRGIRKVIAERMSRSAQTAPHITLTVTVDMTEAEDARRVLNTTLPEGTPSVSVTALLVKACAWALTRHPYLNASLRSEGIYLFHDVHVGVAVALEDGLIVPVIRHANQKGLAAIATELSDLAQRAQQGRLTPDEVTGSTFTITNLGMFGVDQFAAIINPPESAILAVGRIARQAVPLADGNTLVVRPLMTMTLSADHRVVDGAVAARFLADLKKVLEQPILLLS
jgi:pyruvate dehydrogenase E2 component (dihydrolipoamide acetyltransferase)